PNGAARPTFPRLPVGPDQPQAGSVRLFGGPVDTASRRGLVGYLPQRAQLGIEAPATVREVVSAGRVTRRRLLGPLTAADRDAVVAAIPRVGVVEPAARPAP